MEKILVSGCLLGQKVRYDGLDSFYEHPLFKQWQQEGRLIPFCPEVAGGLGIPRIAAEIQGENGGQGVLSDTAIIVNKAGENVTKFFIRGAELTLALAQKHGIRIAILKERSPSCGSNEIYDGSFQGKKISGEGFTTAYLRLHGIQVFSEDELTLVEKILEHND